MRLHKDLPMPLRPDETRIPALIIRGDGVWDEIMVYPCDRIPRDDRQLFGHELKIANLDDMSLTWGLTGFNCVR